MRDHLLRLNWFVDCASVSSNSHDGSTKFEILLHLVRATSSDHNPTLSQVKVYSFLLSSCVNFWWRMFLLPFSWTLLSWKIRIFSEKFTVFVFYRDLVRIFSMETRKKDFPISVINTHHYWVFEVSGAPFPVTENVCSCNSLWCLFFSSNFSRRRKCVETPQL